MDSVMISKYDLPYDVGPNAASYVISLAALFTYHRGRSILKANNSKKELRRFAYLVLFCFILQNVVDYLVELNSSDRVAKMVKVDVVANFDYLSDDWQRFIERNQQVYGCCGVFDWRDYNKAPADVPGKWMNLFFICWLFAALI